MHLLAACGIIIIYYEKICIQNICEDIYIYDILLDDLIIEISSHCMI